MIHHTSQVMAANFQEYDHYKYTVENIRDIIWELDTNLIVPFISSNSKELLGYKTDEMIGRSVLDFLSEDSIEYAYASMKKYRNDRINGTLNKLFLYDVQVVNKDGSSKWFEVSDGPVFKEEQFIGYLGTARDISEKKAHENEVKKYIRELEHTNKKLDKLATVDMLTEVYNRRKFEQDVVLAVEKKEKYGTHFAVIMFDIDGFKQINDQHGHMKGDEFIILLQETSLKNAFKVAEKIRRAVESYAFEGVSDNITISLGVGEYRQDNNLDRFIYFVDNALLKAKSSGKNRTELHM